MKKMFSSSSSPPPPRHFDLIPSWSLLPPILSFEAMSFPNVPLCVPFLLLPSAARQKNVGSHQHYYTTWQFLPDDSVPHCYHNQNLISHSGYPAHNLVYSQFDINHTVP